MHVTDLQRTLDAIESTLDDPHRGLPEELFLFVSRVTPLVNVDLLIQDQHGRTLLTWRDDEFHGAGWHVPGGIIRFKETAADRIRACARQELGVEVAFEGAPIMVHESIRAEAPRGHSIGLLFRCRLLGEPDAARQAVSDPPRVGHWRWHQHYPHNLLSVQHAYARYF
jgi:ADP-ribose pyrophosphatase YjhB (NUDIX family)